MEFFQTLTTGSTPTASPRRQRDLATSSEVASEAAAAAADRAPAVAADSEPAAVSAGEAEEELQRALYAGNYEAAVDIALKVGTLQYLDSVQNESRECETPR